MLVLICEHGLVHQYFVIKCLSDNSKQAGCHFHCCQCLFVKYGHGNFKRRNFEVVVQQTDYRQIQLCYLNFDSSFFFHWMQELDLLCSCCVLIQTLLGSHLDFSLLLKNLVMIQLKRLKQFAAFLIDSSYPFE